jgi:hypothetical protein
MTDELDRASEREQAERDRMLAAATAAAAAMPKGEPGDCDGCGEFFTRLVDGLCGRCRDRRQRTWP